VSQALLPTPGVCVDFRWCTVAVNPWRKQSNESRNIDVGLDDKTVAQVVLAAQRLADPHHGHSHYLANPDLYFDSSYRLAIILMRITNSH